jgi:uncharacterized protein (UPF0248 family)
MLEAELVTFLIDDEKVNVRVVDGYPKGYYEASKITFNEHFVVIFRSEYLALQKEYIPMHRVLSIVEKRDDLNSPQKNSGRK